MGAACSLSEMRTRWRCRAILSLLNCTRIFIVQLVVTSTGGIDFILFIPISDITLVSCSSSFCKFIQNHQMRLRTLLFCHFLFITFWNALQKLIDVLFEGLIAYVHISLKWPSSATGKGGGDPCQNSISFLLNGSVICSELWFTICSITAVLLWAQKRFPYLLMFRQIHI